jgi:hypothetical protein
MSAPRVSRACLAPPHRGATCHRPYGAWRGSDGTFSWSRPGHDRQSRANCRRPQAQRVAVCARLGRHPARRSDVAQASGVTPLTRPGTAVVRHCLAESRLRHRGAIAAALGCTPHRHSIADGQTRKALNPRLGTLSRRCSPPLTLFASCQDTFSEAAVLLTHRTLSAPPLVPPRDSSIREAQLDP